MTDTGSPAFARELLAWFERHGRHDLPWKSPPDAYRIWVSEIMLQQTQVTTVVPYFERFVARFPDLGALAGAPLDDVLNAWSGLGYYARARHLHRAALEIRERHDGQLPAELDALTALPGIGRSTAGAILALAFGQRHPILDGNVKRVLTRYREIQGWPGETRVLKRLWSLADQLTPATRVDEYTQAIMDLGATVCTRTRPACPVCPLAATCEAHRNGRESDYPTPRPRRAPPLKATRFIMARDGDGRLLLERRPPTGIWGGLWSFPEAPLDEDLDTWCRRHLGAASAREHHLPVRRHGFTHYRLDIHPVLVDFADGPATAPEREPRRVMETPQRLWYKPEQIEELGLAAPVRALLRELAAGHLEEGTEDGTDDPLREAR